MEIKIIQIVTDVKFRYSILWVINCRKKLDYMNMNCASITPEYYRDNTGDENEIVPGISKRDRQGAKNVSTTAG